MIRITQIDENQSIFRENKVVLFGAGHTGKTIFKLLQQFDIKVYAYCDNNENLWGTTVNGIKVISPAELQELVKTDEKVLVQVAVGPTRSFLASKSADDVVSQITDFGIEKYIVAQETYHMLNLTNFFNLIIDNADLFSQEYLKQNHDSFLNDHQNRFIDYTLKHKNSDAINLICMPPKTGDYTMNFTFENARIDYINIGHTTNFLAEYIDKCIYSKYCNKIKIITAVREPISQNMSIVFQLLSALGINYSKFLQYNMYCLTNTDLANILKYKDIIFKNGGDVQAFFDNYIKINEIANPNRFTELSIQNFIPSFQENIIDIMKEPFDKEKGYCIIKEDNIEVFVYQLEKLNDIVPALSEWVGVPFDSLVINNVGESKWNGASYKQAQKELKFSQEYFDKCYSEPYVKHFYSEEDIEKFKNRWRGNIRKDGE